MTVRDGARSADGLGWRAKIGLLVPATNTIAQPESELFTPPGVTNHVSRIAPANRGKPGDEAAYRASLARGMEHLKPAIDLVVPCRPDAILLGHSVDTFTPSVEAAHAMRDDFTAYAGGIPMMLPSLAFLKALETLGVGRRIAALTPYFPPGDEKVVGFFRAAGYEIARLIGLKCQGPLAIAATPERDVVEALRTLAGEGVDAIVQPGTNLPTAALAADASRWLGVPVISCNTVNYWFTLRELGIADRIAGYGPLFEDH